MKTGLPTGRASSLVVELGTGTAIVGGERIEIPPGEFELLAALAARSGKAISSKDLLQELWPGDSIVTEVDLRGCVYRLRKRIGDHARDHKIVVNRKGFGYLIDLPSDAIEVVTRVNAADEPDNQVIVLDEDPKRPESDPPPQTSPSIEDAATKVVPEIVELPHTPTGSRGVPLIRPMVVGVAALVATTLLAGAWLVGSWLSSRPSEPPASRGDSLQAGANDPSSRKTRSADRARDKKTQSARSQDGSGSSDAAGQATTLASGSGAETGDSDQGSQQTPTKPEAPSAIPQPDARLFHLYDPGTGDHYVTTDSNAADQKRAAGYTLTVEGRVFRTQSKGTTAISLDGSTAYIYRNATSAPEGLSVAALYRLATPTDLFFTSSSSLANQAEAQGWTRSLAGYVGQ